MPKASLEFLSDRSSVESDRKKNGVGAEGGEEERRIEGWQKGWQRNREEKKGRSRVKPVGRNGSDLKRVTALLVRLYLPRR